MLVDFEVQTSLLRKIAVHWALLLLANAVGLFFWTCLMNAPVESWSELLVGFVRTYIPVLIISLALLPVFLVDAAKLSNRFAGPMVRIRRALSAVLSGDQVEPVQFRENDFWRSMAEDFNQALKQRGHVESDTATDNQPTT
ncbi:MAG: hypothetical protein IT423_06400 [Pirellulaceae bacterium]|nr:hypothetical protein [Pirellulaceae bacterium]